MAEGRYRLRRKLHPTPKSKISQRVLSNRENRTPTPSPSPPSPTQPLPSQPVFAPSTGAPMDISDTSDGVGDPTTAEVEYWLGPGASDDIALMCVDAALTPEDDTAPSSLEEFATMISHPEDDTAPSSVEESAATMSHTDGKDVNAFVANVNPFPPLNPYPQFTFPPNPSFPTSLPPSALPPSAPATSLPPPFNQAVTGLLDDEHDFDAPAEDEDPDLFAASDVGDISSPGDDSASSEQGAHQASGRISTATWETLRAGFQKMDELIDELSHETGRKPENIITLWKRSHARECSRSVWNKYQRYFLDNRPLERRRINDATANCRTCWEGFKRLEPNWREILDAHDEMLTVSGAQLTINSRTRKFDALVKKFRSLAKNASARDGFESLLVVVGNSIHEDTGLTEVYVSLGADKFIEERLRFDESTMTGLFRNHVCNRVSVDLQERLETDRQTLADSAVVSSSMNVQQRDKEGLAIAEAKAIIKAGFQRVLQPFTLGISLEEIPWVKLGGSLVRAGLRIENWPRGVVFPCAVPSKKKEVTPGATTVRKRITSQGIKDLGNPGIRLFAESFKSEATTIRVVTANSDLLLASKIPLYVEAPPGPGSLDVIRHAFANGHKDFLTPGDKEYKTFVGPRTSDTSVAPRRTRSRVKKEKSPDAPLLQASKRRALKKSKEIISDSDEISDEDDDPKRAEKKGNYKGKATARTTTTKDIKGKGKAKDREEDQVIPIDVDAEPATQAPPIKSSRKLASPPIATEANLGPFTDTPKLVFKPLSSFIAATQAVAAAARAEGGTKAISQLVPKPNPEPAPSKPTPRPIKKPTVAIWDSGDPFLVKPSVKPSVSTNEGHLRGPAQSGQPPKARTPHHTEATVPPNVSESTTTATHKKTSAFGPPRYPTTAPPSSPNSSKRVADGEKSIDAAAPKRLRSAPKLPSPERDVGAQAPQESSSGERMTAEVPAASSAQPAAAAAATPAQAYQWPYGPYYPPFGFPPAPGWPYPSFSQDRPAGSAGDSAPAFPFPPHPMMPFSQERPAGSAGDSAPAFPFPPHPMMPFPPFYHAGAGAAAAANVPVKPAEGEPGPSRST